LTAKPKLDSFIPKIKRFLSERRSLFLKKASLYVGLEPAIVMLFFFSISKWLPESDPDESSPALDFQIKISFLILFGLPASPPAECFSSIG
jgi:hypothetical protein